MYRAFRGADPNKIAMLVARGLVEPEEIADVEPLPVNEIVRVDTREQARQRAERSRREREAARLQAKADSLATADSLQSVELKPIERATPMQLGLEPIKK